MHFDLEFVHAVYLVPRRIDDHPLLFSICESVERVLTDAYQELRHLHVVDAKRLNSISIVRIGFFSRRY